MLRYENTNWRQCHLKTKTIIMRGQSSMEKSNEASSNHTKDVGDPHVRQLSALRPAFNSQHSSTAKWDCSYRQCLIPVLHPAACNSIQERSAQSVCVGALRVVLFLKVGSHDCRSLQPFPRIYYYASPALMSETTLPVEKARRVC